MILDRYLAREIAKPLFVFCPALLLLFSVFTAARYMEQVASGMMPVEVVLPLVFLKAAVALEILLPVALHLSVVVAFGRLYTDSEMTALFACGVSPERILRVVLLVSAIAATAAACLSLYVRPWANDLRYRLQNQAVAEFDFDRMEPGRFYGSSSGRYVMFFHERDHTTRRMRDVFIQTRSEGLARLVSAEQAYYDPSDDPSGGGVLVCLHARVYELSHGDGDVLTATTGELSIQMEAPGEVPIGYKPKTTSTWQLARSESAMDIAELQWRLSTPISAFLLGMLGFPLSRTEARKGKYAKLSIAVVIFALYYYVSLMAKKWVEQGIVDPVPGLWWAHALLAALVVGLLWGRSWIVAWRSRYGF